jgi:biotin carboxylase
MEFKDKRLLIIGGNPETVPLVRVAKMMGLYTIVSDDNPSAMAKKFADKKFDVNGLDVQGLVEIARKEEVNGVLVGVADILIGAYYQVCKILGLPCYATQTLVDVFTQKDNFKKTCAKHGVYGIPQYKIDAELKDEDLTRVEFPVLVKPVDNGGGVGMSVCHNKEELKEGIQKALANSRRRCFIVEKYMTCDDTFVYYTFRDGEYYLSAMADRFTTKEQGKLSPVCMAAVYPSKYMNLYYETMHKNMCRMFKDLGVQNGVLLIQAFAEDGKLHVYDPGFRLQGEAPHLLINAINGFDQRELLIRFALTGSMGNQDLSVLNDSNFRGKAAGSLWVLLKQGTISKIEGLDEVKNDPTIVKIVQRLKEGDSITGSMIGNEKQVLARLYVVCDTKEQYRAKIREIQSKVRVFDEKEQNMQLTSFDVNQTWN